MTLPRRILGLTLLSPLMLWGAAPLPEPGTEPLQPSRPELQAHQAETLAVLPPKVPLGGDGSSVIPLAPTAADVLPARRAPLLPARAPQARAPKAPRARASAPAGRRSYLMRMRVTAYSPDRRSCGIWADGITASGKNVYTNGSRFVAADTRILPFGTQVAIPGYNGGVAVPVLDRGGAIKGNRLDVFFRTHEQARRWGTRWVMVRVYEPAR